MTRRTPCKKTASEKDRKANIALGQRVESNSSCLDGYNANGFTLKSTSNVRNRMMRWGTVLTGSSCRLLSLSDRAPLHQDLIVAVHTVLAHIRRHHRWLFEVVTVFIGIEIIALPQLSWVELLYVNSWECELSDRFALDFDGSCKSGTASQARIIVFNVGICFFGQVGFATFNFWCDIICMTRCVAERYTILISVDNSMRKV